MECKVVLLWLVLFSVYVCGTKATNNWPDCTSIQRNTACSWEDTEDESSATMINGCECDSRLRSYNVTCTCTDQQLVLNLPPYVWLGYEDRSGDLTMEVSSSDTDPLDDLIVVPCTLNYCKREGKSVSPVRGDFDIQCNYNRTGVLCGTCRGNLSSVFGSTDCKKCNNYTLFLILVFAIAGITLFAMLSFLQMTVDKGWLYMILLYSNLISLFLFFWGDLDEYYLHIFFLPTAFLSLQIGTSLCFYDGMSTIARAGLQFVFPTYLILLMLLFTLLARSRRFMWFGKHFSPVKTFATLIMMCYISILATCVEILGAVRISTLGGEASYRWSYDPTQYYFQGVHLFLGIVAICFIVCYIIPFPILLFSPWIAYRYTKKFAPFYDALWAPFKPKYRFWLSIRIFILFTIITLSIATDLQSCLFYSVLALLIFILVQLTIKPFKSEWQSRADTFLIGNAIALKSGAIFVIAYDKSNDTKFKIAISFLTVIAILLAYSVFLAIIYYSLAQRYPILKKVVKPKELMALMKSGKSKKNEKETTISSESLSDSVQLRNNGVTYPDVTHTEVFLSEHGNRAFSRLRESLLEPGDSVEP